MLAVIVGTIFFLNYMMSMLFGTGFGIVVYTLNKTKCIEAGIGIGIALPNDFKGVKLVEVINTCKPGPAGI